MRELLQQALDELKEARRNIQEWGCYATGYFQQKYDLLGCIEKPNVTIKALEAELAKPEQELCECIDQFWCATFDRCKRNDRKPSL